jgi:hypothetical protein
MATKTTVTLEDDLDGGPADETLRFAIGGAEYEIDLSVKNARAFRRQLAPFISHARRAGRGQHRRPARTAAGRQRSGTIRARAKDKEFPSAHAGASQRTSCGSTKPRRRAADGLRGPPSASGLVPRLTRSAGHPVTGDDGKNGG